MRVLTSMNAPTREAIWVFSEHPWATLYSISAILWIKWIFCFVGSFIFITTLWTSLRMSSKLKPPFLAAFIFKISKNEIFGFTIERITEFLLGQDINHLGNVFWGRTSCATVNSVNLNVIVCQWTTFKHIQDFSHVTIREFHNSILGFWVYWDAFLICDFTESNTNMVVGEWWESEPCASGLQCRDNLGDIITNEAKPCCLNIFFNH